MINIITGFKHILQIHELFLYTRQFRSFFFYILIAFNQKKKRKRIVKHDKSRKKNAKVRNGWRKVWLRACDLNFRIKLTLLAPNTL